MKTAFVGMGTLTVFVYWVSARVIEQVRPARAE
jgi:hypothetical protein